ncbi:MAG: hypothetical protein Q7I99_08640 [Acholeplasmataceae bacterium]|nr:hypothetical protein [Acholeplasmataceae bacterium]
MLKWLIRFFYLMIISIATIYVYGSANYSRLEAYYSDYMEEHLDDAQTYLKGINTLMGLDYYSNSAVYQYVQDSGNHQLTVSIYAIGVTLNNELYDGLMIYVNNVKIREEGVLVENPKLKITVTLDQSTYKSGDDFISTATVLFDPDKAFPYSYVPNVFLLYADNYLKVVNQDIYANIERISISYSNGTLDDKNALVYNDSLLFLGTDIIASEAAFNKTNDLVLNPDDFRLSKQFAGEQPTAEELLSFNLITDRGDLGEYNILIWRTMIIYVLIIGALTYVLFFHKIVKAKIQEKRYQTKDDNKKEVNAVPIFKDIEYKDDGK